MTTEVVRVMRFAVNRTDGKFQVVLDLLGLIYKNAMNYTNLTLFGLGLLGILLHNLVELNKLNRANKGSVRLGEYFKLERFSILISVVVVGVSLIVKAEITQLEQVGKWLGLAFMAIGYMGQSLLVFVMGKAEKKINKDNEEAV